MIETGHAQWKIAKIGEKQRREAKISTSYRKSMSLNPFSVKNLRPEIELMYLLRMRRILSSQKLPKMVSRARNDRDFIEKWVRWIQIWRQILNRK